MSKAYLSLSRVDMTFPGPNGGNPNIGSDQTTRIITST